MRIGKSVLVLTAGMLAAFGVMGTAGIAGPTGMIRLTDMSGVNVDLAVHQVTVTPVRAYVGDKIRVDIVVENKGEGSDTTNAELYANGKRVGRQLFTWGPDPGKRLYRLSFDWDTRGLPPGEYKIRAEAFVSRDTSPFDNELKVRQPVVLVPSGGKFPGGETAGGSATETDPQFDAKRLGG